MRIKIKKCVAAPTPQKHKKEVKANSAYSFKSLSEERRQRKNKAYFENSNPGPIRGPWDPDDLGNSWRGMYYLERCPQPDCDF